MSGPDPLLVQVLGEVRDLRLEVRELRADLAGRGRPQADVANAELLRAIESAVGYRAFNSAELSRHAALPDAASLATAIVAAVGSMKPRRIGKALSAIEGRDIGGLMVSHVGEDRDGAIWMVCGSCGSTPTLTVAPRRARG